MTVDLCTYLCFFTSWEGDTIRGVQIPAGAVCMDVYIVCHIIVVHATHT